MNPTIDVTEELENYKKDLESSLYQIENDLREISLSTDPTQKSKFNEIEIELKSSESNVRLNLLSIIQYSQIELEIKSLPKKNQAKYSTLLDTYSRRITKSKKLFNELKYSKVIIDSTKDTPEAKLINIGKSLIKGNKDLTDTIKTMNNVNNRDKDNLVMLNQQTEKISDSKNKLNEAQSIISRSNLLVRGLLRKVASNKMILITIIILLGLLIVLVLYLKIKRRLFG